MDSPHDICAFPECRKSRSHAVHNQPTTGWIGQHEFEVIEPAIDWRARALTAEKLLNAPEILDFAKAVQFEVAHQRSRWGSDHDAGKSDADWFWLIGFLGGKALRAEDGLEKQLHRIITVAAAACNWHAAKLGQTNMRPGIETQPGEDGQHGEPLDAVRSESFPSGGKSGASAEPGSSRPAAAPADQPAALAPDELCDIDDLPDCRVGGVHQAHCRHAGKPVGSGGNL